jgi:heptosyltransferase-2
MGIKRSILEVCVTTMRVLCRCRKVKQPLSILVLRNNDLGDVVAITPLFQALRMAFPDATLVAAVGAWSKEILKFNPYLSKVIECNAPWHNHQSGPKSLLRPLKYIFQSPEVAQLQAENFDVGIDVLGSPFGSMLLLRLRIPIRLGRKGYAGGHTGATAYLQASNSVSVAEGAIEFVRLLKSGAEIDLGPRPQLFLDPSEIEAAQNAWREMEAQSGSAGPRVVMAPGAGTPDKQWPVERFAQLAGRLSPQVCGCVLGSPADFALGETVVRGSNGWTNRCGRVSIRESMALISLADLVICHSSFVMHLASAFNKRCILIMTRSLDWESHLTLWERPGVHFRAMPREGEEHVRVEDLEQQARLLLKAVER